MDSRPFRADGSHLAFRLLSSAVGLPPMEYLLAWRMAVAKDLLRREDVGIGDAIGLAFAADGGYALALTRERLPASP